MKSILLAVLISMGTGLAHAQTFPNKPIRVYSSYTSGTGADTVIRLVGAALSERIKQPVVIEQKLGAAGIVALSALKQATPDGYTLGMVASSNAVQPSLVKNLPFDITRDFTPITNMYAGPMVVTVPSSLPVRNLAEFVSYARSNPGKVFYGSAGVGSVSHLSGALLSNFGGFTMTHIPFKGTPEKNVAQLSGDIQISFDNYSVPKALIEAGKFRVIGVTSKQRWSSLPNVPTLAETYPDMQVTFWVGLVAPLGVPKDAYDTLTTEIRAAIRTPATSKRISETGGDPSAISPQEFSQLIATDVDKWKKAAQAAGIRPE